jgi:hypothetical protein
VKAQGCPSGERQGGKGGRARGVKNNNDNRNKNKIEARIIEIKITIETKVTIHIRIKQIRNSAAITIRVISVISITIKRTMTPQQCGLPTSYEDRDIQARQTWKDA